MPLGTVNIYAELGYIMEAKERLSNIMDRAAASGTLKKGAHFRHMRFLRRRAGSRTTMQGDEDRKPQALTKEVLQAFGIEVVNG